MQSKAINKWICSLLECQWFGHTKVKGDMRIIYKYLLVEDTVIDQIILLTMLGFGIN